MYQVPDSTDIKPVNMKKIFIILLVCVLNAATFAQSKKEGVYSTRATFEIKNYKGILYTPCSTLCQDAKTKDYYHLSNYENYSDSCLVFYLGTFENAKVLYKKINEYILSNDTTLNVTINDAKNRKFRLQASPQKEKQHGAFIIIQEEGADKWGIISKNHIRNFSRVFPEN